MTQLTISHLRLAPDALPTERAIVADLEQFEGVTLELPPGHAVALCAMLRRIMRQQAGTDAAHDANVIFEALASALPPSVVAYLRRPIGSLFCPE